MFLISPRDEEMRIENFLLNYQLAGQLHKLGMVKEELGTLVGRERIEFLMKLWNLKLPNKAKNFAWRTCSGNSSTKLE